jgi:hydrogenase maturation factor
VCLGEYGTIVAVIDVGRAIVGFADGRTSEVSLAVLAAEGTSVRPGDRVMVSIGMALHLDEPRQSGSDRFGRDDREVAR